VCGENRIWRREDSNPRARERKPISSSCKAGSLCPSLSLISAKYIELVTAFLPLPRKMHGFLKAKGTSGHFCLPQTVNLFQNHYITVQMLFQVSKKVLKSRHNSNPKVVFVDVTYNQLFAILHRPCLSLRKEQNRQKMRRLWKIVRKLKGRKSICFFSQKIAEIR